MNQDDERHLRGLLSSVVQLIPEDARSQIDAGKFLRDVALVALAGWQATRLLHADPLRRDEVRRLEVEAWTLGDSILATMPQEPRQDPTDDEQPTRQCRDCGQSYPLDKEHWVRKTWLRKKKGGGGEGSCWQQPCRQCERARNLKHYHKKKRKVATS